MSPDNLSQKIYTTSDRMNVSYVEDSVRTERNPINRFQASCSKAI